MFWFAAQRLVILRGPEHAGKGELARTLAARLAAPASVVALRDIRDRWIVQPAADPDAELEMCYRLLRLITLQHLKEGYSVVIDAPFVDVSDTVTVRETDVTDLVRLARSLRAVRPAVVTLLSAGEHPDSARAAAALLISHLGDEIRVEGEGGDIAGFAEALANRIREL